MARSKKISVDRRGFLKGAAAGAAALYMASFIEPNIQSIDDGGPLSSSDLVNLDRSVMHSLYGITLNR